MILSNERGISIVGAVLILLVLIVFGCALIALVATQRESRGIELSMTRAFYEVQAGLEYASREVNEGWYPIVAGKGCAVGSFTTAINQSNRRLTVQGFSNASQDSHYITLPNLASNCTSVTVSGATVGGVGSTDVSGITIRKTCLNGINIESFVFSWTPTSSTNVKQIVIDSTTIYDHITGIPQGQVVDSLDTRLTDAASHTLSLIKFSGSMAGKAVTMRVNFTDSSYITKQFNL